MGLAKKYLGKRFDVQTKLAALENPVDVIAKVVENLKPLSLSRCDFNCVANFGTELFRGVALV